jgi:hypothetical protein
VNGLWRAEPAALIGAVRAVLVAAVGFGLDLSAEQITSLVLALEAIATVLTRKAVVSPVTLVEATKKAATTAASVVAEDLAPDTVGIAGRLSDAGAVVADVAAADAAHQVLKDLGVSRKDRAA